MRVLSLFTSVLVVSNVVACGADESNAPRQMRQEAPSDAGRQVQIGPHGSMAQVHSDSTDPKIAAANLTGAPRASAWRHGALSQQKSKSKSSGPKLTGYKNNDCGGTTLGSFVLPEGADMTGDHCLAVRDADSDKEAGRIKISCDGSGVAKACIWHNPNDTACELSEPFCLNVQAVDTPLVAGGACVPVKEHPNEEDSYARFTDFPADALWPDCLVPPMSMSLMLITVLGGVAAGSIVLCAIWYICLAQSPKPKHMDGGKGFGKGGWGEGHGEGKGKGWGKGEGEGEGLPASLPGVPAPLEAPPPGGKPGFGPPGGKGKPGMGFGGKPMGGKPGWGK